MKKGLLILLIIAPLFIPISSTNPHQSVSSKKKDINLLSLEKIKTPKCLKASLKKIQELPSEEKKNKLLLKLSLKALHIDKNSYLFNEINSLAQKQAIKLKDSNSLAAAYWDRGSFYKKKESFDSAFYYYNKSKNIYAALNNNYLEGRLYINMSATQKEWSDYTGAEVNLVNALKCLNKIDHPNETEYEKYYRIYNLLGIIYNELEEYEKAIEAHNTAQKYIKKANIQKSLPHSLNNLGVVYSNKRDYNRSIQYYNIALKTDSLYFKEPKLYAMLLDNLGYSQFKIGKNENVPKLFYESFAIRDSLNYIDGIMVSNLHLAEYYLLQKDTAKAFAMANRVIKTGPIYNHYTDVLEALLLLNKIDPVKGNIFLDKYINLKDSLQLEERRTRNKFAKIQFDTNIYISKNKKLNKKILIFSFLTGLLILTSVFIYFYQHQRTKNKTLILTKEKHEAILEIERLLSEQDEKMERTRKEEKDRVSKELHDNILSQLFGIQINLELLNNKNTTEEKEKRWFFINKLNETTGDIRKIAHELTTSHYLKADFISLVTELILEQEATGINFDLSLDDKINWNKIDKSVQLNLFRIIQEGIQNIHNHSKADNAWITITLNSKMVYISIIDDGIGISRNKNNKGIGLKNIYDRSENINASVQLLNNEPKGTILTISLTYG